MPNLRIVPLANDSIEDWSRVFLKGMKSFRWMLRYLRDLNITEVDVEHSIKEDLAHKKESEQFLIAYLDNIPVGIIRLDEYWIVNSIKVLSHFPLVLPRFQGRNIGRALVLEGVKNAFRKGFDSVWSECWSKDNREIKVYNSFYEKCGFISKSNRYEMSCLIQKMDFDNIVINDTITINTSHEITNDLILSISKAYAKSEDRLHSIEKLGDKENAKIFLNRTKRIFEELGYSLESFIAYDNNNPCAGLLTATTNKSGIILEIGVIPEFRKMKLAQTLIIKYLKKLQKKDISEVILGVDESNLPAIDLYEKLGFRITWKGNVMLLEDKKKLGLE